MLINCRSLLSVLAVLLVFVCVGCLLPPCPEPNIELNPTFDANSASITNPWVGPFNVGDTQTFSGYGGFEGRTMTYSITGKATVLGTECLTVCYEHTGNAAFPEHEVVNAYMAQDTDGNVWVLNTNSLDRSELFFPANPQQGGVYLSAGYGADAYLEILATNASARRPDTEDPICTNGLLVRWTRNCGTSDLDIDYEVVCPNFGVAVKVWDDEGTNGWVRD